MRHPPTSRQLQQSEVEKVLVGGSVVFGSPNFICVAACGQSVFRTVLPPASRLSRMITCIVLLGAQLTSMSLTPSLTTHVCKLVLQLWWVVHPHCLLLLRYLLKAVLLSKQVCLDIEFSKQQTV